jgi:hypothetical protein
VYVYCRHGYLRSIARRLARDLGYQNLRDLSLFSSARKLEVQLIDRRRTFHR